MKTTDNCILFEKKGLLGSKHESFNPTDMSWPNDVWVKIGPVSLKLYATQFTVFSENPKLAWNRDVFLEIIANPNMNALTFLSSASNVVFASYDRRDIEWYASLRNTYHHDFVSKPLAFKSTLNKKGETFVSIAYKKI